MNVLHVCCAVTCVNVLDVYYCNYTLIKLLYMCTLTYVTHTYNMRLTTRQDDVSSGDCNEDRGQPCISTTSDVNQHAGQKIVWIRAKEGLWSGLE